MNKLFILFLLFLYNVISLSFAQMVNNQICNFTLEVYPEDGNVTLLPQDFQGCDYLTFTLVGGGGSGGTGSSGYGGGGAAGAFINKTVSLFNFTEPITIVSGYGDRPKNIAYQDLTYGQNSYIQIGNTSYIAYGGSSAYGCTIYSTLRCSQECAAYVGGGGGGGSNSTGRQCLGGNGTVFGGSGSANSPASTRNGGNGSTDGVYYSGAGGGVYSLVTGIGGNSVFFNGGTVPTNCGGPAIASSGGASALAAGGNSTCGDGMNGTLGSGGAGANGLSGTPGYGGDGAAFLDFFSFGPSLTVTPTSSGSQRFTSSPSKSQSKTSSTSSTAMPSHSLTASPSPSYSSSFTSTSSTSITSSASLTIAPSPSPSSFLTNLCDLNSTGLLVRTGEGGNLINSTTDLFIRITSNNVTAVTGLFEVTTGTTICKIGYNSPDTFCSVHFKDGLVVYGGQCLFLCNASNTTASYSNGLTVPVNLLVCYNYENDTQNIVSSSQPISLSNSNSKTGSVLNSLLTSPSFSLSTLQSISSSSIPIAPSSTRSGAVLISTPSPSALETQTECSNFSNGPFYLGRANRTLYIPSGDPFSMTFETINPLNKSFTARVVIFHNSGYQCRLIKQTGSIKNLKCALYYSDDYARPVFECESNEDPLICHSNEYNQYEYVDNSVTFEFLEEDDYADILLEVHYCSHSDDQQQHNSTVSTSESLSASATQLLVATSSPRAISPSGSANNTFTASITNTFSLSVSALSSPSVLVISGSATPVSTASPNRPVDGRLIKCSNFTDCNRNGFCILGQCYCAPGFYGARCELPSMINTNSTKKKRDALSHGNRSIQVGNMTYSKNEIYCLLENDVNCSVPPLSDIDLSEGCDNNCGNEGICILGNCFCSNNKTGENCTFGNSTYSPCKEYFFEPEEIECEIKVFSSFYNACVLVPKRERTTCGISHTETGTFRMCNIKGQCITKFSSSTYSTRDVMVPILLILGVIMLIIIVAFYVMFGRGKRLEYKPIPRRQRNSFNEDL